MRTATPLRAAVLAAAALLTVTACGGGDDPAAADGGGSAEKQVNVYGADGNMNNGLGEDFSEPGVLAGMRGTVLLTDLGQEFRDRLLAIDPDLTNFNTAGETYDAVVITALAAQLAGSNQATAFAPYVNGVTFGGEVCT